VTVGQGRYRVSLPVRCAAFVPGLPWPALDIQRRGEKASEIIMSSVGSDDEALSNGRQSKAVIEVPVTLAGPRRRGKQRPPQESIDEFWSRFTTKAPGIGAFLSSFFFVFLCFSFILQTPPLLLLSLSLSLSLSALYKLASVECAPNLTTIATRIIPQNEYAERVAKRSAARVVGGGQSAKASYEEAAQHCRDKVAKIVKECRRVNQKYRDPHFDLEADLKQERRDCLESLNNWRDEDKEKEFDNRDMLRPPAAAAAPEAAAGDGPAIATLREQGFHPKAVKRVVDIFDNPQFYIDGPTANDVRQGRDGDCWLMAALCTMSNKPGLIERNCVAYDQVVGVYGFVFHRDGEWFSEIIDDKVSMAVVVVFFFFLSLFSFLSFLSYKSTSILISASSTSPSPTTTRASWSGSSGRTERGSTRRSRTARRTSPTAGRCTLRSARTPTRRGCRSWRRPTPRRTATTPPSRAASRARGSRTSRAASRRSCTRPTSWTRSTSGRKSSSRSTRRSSSAAARACGAAAGASARASSSCTPTR